MLTEKEKFTAIENCKVHKRRVNFCGDWVGLVADFQTFKGNGRHIYRIEIQAF